MIRLPSTRHPLTTLAVASAVVLAACSDQSALAPKSTNRVNRTSTFFFATSLGDLTWVDVNGNGIQDVGDAPLPNVTLNLYAGTVCGGTPIQTQVSDPITGYYQFYVTAGTYSVEAVTPMTYAPTAAEVGADREIDSNRSCTTATVADGEANVSLDFGYVSAVRPTQGCTPGYWKNHRRWPAPYTQSTLFSAVFANAFPNKTFQQVLSQGGGGLNALGRHTVSAFLNAGAIGSPTYGLTSSQIISEFNAAFASKVYDPTKNRFESFSDAYPGITCPLN